MKPFALGKSIRWPVGVLLALLASVVAFPARVEAGCSPYVTSGTGHERLVPILTPRVLGGTETTTPAPTSLPAPGLPRPCSGPSCSGKPALPPPPPSIAVTRHVESWAYLETPLASAPSRPLLIPPELSDLRPFHQGPAIFHPPRLCVNRPVS